MDSGYLKGVRRLTEVKAIEKPFATLITGRVIGWPLKKAAQQESTVTYPLSLLMSKT